MSPSSAPAKGLTRTPAGSLRTHKSETAEMDGGIVAADASYPYLNDYFSKTATKGSLGSSPNMVRTFQPVPRTS